MKPRSDHCRDCPFREGIPAELRTPDRDGAPLVLCHESGSLDGPGPDEWLCYAETLAMEA